MFFINKMAHTCESGIVIILGSPDNILGSRKVCGLWSPCTAALPTSRLRWLLNAIRACNRAPRRWAARATGRLSPARRSGHDVDASSRGSACVRFCIFCDFAERGSPSPLPAAPLPERRQPPTGVTQNAPPLVGSLPRSLAASTSRHIDSVAPSAMGAIAKLQTPTGCLPPGPAHLATPSILHTARLTTWSRKPRESTVLVRRRWRSIGCLWLGQLPCCFVQLTPAIPVMQIRR